MAMVTSYFFIGIEIAKIITADMPDPEGLASAFRPGPVRAVRQTYHLG